jgi:FlaA1/EpsC-like NDP-sugar epimerase
LRSSLTSYLRERPPLFKLLITVSVDVVVLTILAFASFALRVSQFTFPPENTYWLYLVAVALSVLSAAYFKIYSAISRNFTPDVERQIVLSQLLMLGAWALITLFSAVPGFARSTLLIYTILAIFAMIGVRRWAAWLFTEGHSKTSHRDQIPVAIYGAGREGIALFEEMKRQGKYKPVAFFDTDYTLIGRSVSGLGILDTSSIKSAIAKHNLREVVIAKPEQSRASRRALVDLFIDNGLTVKTIPASHDVLEGKVNINDIRAVQLEDLLGRDPVAPDNALMEKAIKGRRVMVTGAGGSIGSELVRQAQSFGARALYLVENNEFALFQIHREMEQQIRSGQLDQHIIPLLVDVCSQETMSKLVLENEIEVLIHAAAYKHVRMVQENPIEGIRNNVLGSQCAARAAVAGGVKYFILVSTDKAVRPTSVMGASKRVAEMVIQALASQPGQKTIFSIVRFGNVLGSTGSVVPIFRDQIARGGPVSVTHPDVTRYFMLISEAAQLVIQAGAMADGGEVFVLDMGESVKILQLATTMIELAGLTVKNNENPDGDIEIKFTGLSDGEKLYEELQIGRDVSATPHSRIMRSKEFFLSPQELSIELDRLQRSLTNDQKEEAVAKIMYLAGLGSLEQAS